MAKRVTKKVNSTELDSKEFFAAIAQIEEEKGLGDLFQIGRAHV